MKKLFNKDGKSHFSTNISYW